jgi:hypothetical protein
VEVTELVESVQADLTRLKRYFTANKLTLNADKTSYLVFRALNKKLFYGKSPIKRESQIPWIIYGRALYTRKNFAYGWDVVQTEVLFAIWDTEINLPCIYSQ